MLSTEVGRTHCMLAIVMIIKVHFQCLKGRLLWWGFGLKHIVNIAMVLHCWWLNWCSGALKSITRNLRKISNFICWVEIHWTLMDLEIIKWVCEAWKGNISLLLIEIWCEFGFKSRPVLSLFASLVIKLELTPQGEDKTLVEPCSVSQQGVAH